MPETIGGISLPTKGEVTDETMLPLIKVTRDWFTHKWLSQYTALLMDVCMDSYGNRCPRLKGYDYAQPGAYFVTVCTYRRDCLLANVVDGAVIPNPPGQLVHEAWHGLPDHYPHVGLDAFVIMPNHVHGIIVLSGDGVEAGLKPASTIRHALPEVVRGFKTFSSRRINAWRQTPGTHVWQRNYYEHVIRSDRELDQIREYIATNPLRWAVDRENPQRTGYSAEEEALFGLEQHRISQ